MQHDCLTKRWRIKVPSYSVAALTGVYDGKVILDRHVWPQLYDMCTIGISDGNNMHHCTIPMDWLEALPFGHDFPDFGCKRSWCRHCGTEGLFDWQTGRYK